ncbi:alpha/beta fold hydrolase [Nonomuraea longicatena]|uniref:Alpha/beta hydrolase n=1 Tax=Nonomuraea longicatena TaxID=83682 RepID=A0ABN1Q0W1_9ACTN
MTAIYKSEAGADLLQSRYRQVLDAWPVPAERVRVPTREGETFVLVSGPEDAPPLLLLHGSAGNAAMWRDDVAAWTRDFRTYAVDIIGEPGLSAPSRPPMDSGAYAAWLDDVLAALGLTAVSVAGISLGGWTALDYATRRPERVTRLAVMCPGGVGRTKSGWLFKAVFLRLFGERGLRRSAREVAGLHGPGLESVLDDVVLTFRHFNPRTARLPRFTDETLSGLTIPVLVIVGARDALFDSAETAERVRRCLPGARVRVLPGVGHSIFGQTDTVSDFLRERP